MSLAKAQDPSARRLRPLAADASLEDICAEFGVSHRTAQRMTEAPDITFANVMITDCIP